MKLRVFLLGIVLGAALVISAVSAQTSIILDATFGLFEDDEDNFLDPNDYGDVEFDNAFIYLRGSDRSNARGVQRNSTTGAFDSVASGRINDNTAGIQGGFGTRISSLYLGLGFDTSLWQGTETITETDGKRNDTINNWDSTDAPEKGIVFDGRFGVLLGTGNIGAFKLSLDFDQVSLNNNKNETNDASPEEFTYSDGKVLIDIGWGKNFNLKGGLLSPEFHIGYNISALKAEQKNPGAFSYVTRWNDVSNSWETEYFKTMSHLLVNPSAEYLSPTGAHWFGFGYGLDVGIHPNVIEKDAAKEVNWKGYYVDNILAGAYVRTVELTDRFTLAFGGNLGLGLLAGKLDYTDIVWPVEEFVEFSVNPDIEIGVTYDFVKKPFRIYSALKLGSVSGDADEVNFYTLSYSKTKSDAFPTTEEYTHELVPWGLSAGLGLKFTPFRYFVLDLGLSQNLSYYVSDKLEYVWAWDILNWNAHPFTAAIQATIKF